MGLFQKLFKELGAVDWAKKGLAADRWSKGSAILTEEGLPQILYTGTPHPGFTYFSSAHGGMNSGAKDAKGFAAFLSSRPNVANEYAVTVPQLVKVIKRYCAGQCLPQEPPAGCTACIEYRGLAPCPCWPFRMGRNPYYGDEQRAKLRQHALRQLELTGSQAVFRPRIDGSPSA